jgi:predicted amidohydrolase YtcJ
MKQDKTTGSLEAGKRADLVVLDRDILSVDPETIQDTKVLATYLDGRLAYSAPDQDEGAWWDQREARMRDWLHRD